MPIVPHRASFTELIAQAATQRKSERKRDEQKMHIMKLESRKNLGSTDEDPHVLTGMQLEPLVIMAHMRIFLLSRPWRFFHSIWFMIAIVTLTLATTRMSDYTLSAVIVLDHLVDAIFLLEGVLKLMSTLISLIYHVEDTKSAFAKFLEMGVLDIVVACVSLSSGRTILATWFRLFRVIVIISLSLRSLEHIDVLISGISLGVASLLSTWLLLTVVFFMYAACAVTFFSKNDPYHFGSIAMSMWTFFEMSTLDGWEEVLYINMYGCNKNLNIYEMGDDNYDGPDSLSAYGGDMFLPLCRHPEPRPLLSSFVFITFILVCAFILVSLTLAAVTLGINERINEIKSVNEKEDCPPMQPKDASEDLEEFNPTVVVSKLKRLWHYQDAASESIIGRAMSSRKIHAELDYAPEAPAEPMVDTSSIDDGSSVGIYTPTPAAPNKSSMLAYQQKVKTSGVIERGESGFHWTGDLSFMDRLKMEVAAVSDTNIYGLCLAALIIFSAFVEIWALQIRARAEYINVIQALIQVLFIFDLAGKFILQHPNYSRFFDNNWNRFDFTIVLLTCLPFVLRDREYMGLLRVLRVLRILYLLTWITNLKIMMMSIVGSLQPLLYVGFLMSIFFYFFAVAGVLMFRRNDSYHFGSLDRAFITLFQVVTLASWSDVARMNMYGCDLLSPDTYQYECDDPVALGWIAAWYFILFILFGVMILVSLFVGIIITSMELLKDSIAAETAMRIKIRQKQKHYNMDDFAVNSMLEIYEILDRNSTSVLTLLELRPVLELIANEADQIRMFMKADDNNSGQIDFSEFLDIVHMLGDHYRLHQKEVNKNIKRVKEAIGIAKREHRSYVQVLAEMGVRTKEYDNMRQSAKNEVGKTPGRSLKDCGRISTPLERFDEIDAEAIIADRECKGEDIALHHDSRYERVTPRVHPSISMVSGLSGFSMTDEMYKATPRAGDERSKTDFGDECSTGLVYPRQQTRISETGGSLKLQDAFEDGNGDLV